jgi:hypothetical protein
MKLKAKGVKQTKAYAEATPNIPRANAPDMEMLMRALAGAPAA